MATAGNVIIATCLGLFCTLEARVVQDALTPAEVIEKAALKSAGWTPASDRMNLHDPNWVRSLLRISSDGHGLSNDELRAVDRHIRLLFRSHMPEVVDKMTEVLKSVHDMGLTMSWLIELMPE